MRIRSLLTVVALFVLAAGCDKATDASSNEKPTMAVITISVPMANFTDTCNAPAYSYASLAQSMVTLATMYSQLPNGTNVNGVWTWNFTEGAMTATLTARKLSSGQYEWKLVLNGTDGPDTYTNWTAFLATSSADGKSGTLTIYNDTPTPSTDIAVLLTWSTGANNVVTVDYESVPDLMKFILVSNGTTGEVTTYQKVSSNWVADGYHATWTAPGALATC